MIPKAILLISLLCSVQLLTAQTKMNVTLKAQLDSIYAVDQVLRMYFVGETTPAQRDSIEKATGYSKEELRMSNIWNIINYHDSLNMIQVESIIAEYGYPGKSLVGTPTNEAAFYVIQHSPKIFQYFPLIEKAGKRNELSFTLVAKMHDRLLVNQKKEQKYGTQAFLKRTINPITGEPESTYYIWPIKNVKSVNKRRKKAGFSNTVQESAKLMDIDYTIVTLKETEDDSF